MSSSSTISLKQTLTSISQSIANGDSNPSNESTSHLVHLLDSISSDDNDSDTCAFEALELIYNHLTSPSIDQAVTDALSFDLPKAAAKLGCVSERCFQYAERIVNRFVESCSPRDMVSILCEAINTPSDECNNFSYFSPLLGALAKVFEAPQRRQFEQVKTALPVVFKVLEAMLSDLEDEDTRSVDLLEKALLIASSLKAICVKIDHKDEKLFALFGVYVLQITVVSYEKRELVKCLKLCKSQSEHLDRLPDIPNPLYSPPLGLNFPRALISNSVGAETSRYFPIMLQLSHFLRYCGYTYLGLITGHEVDRAIDLLSQGDEDNYMSCFSYVRSGAPLTVLWRDLSNDVADATKEELDAVKGELRSNQTKRWEAIYMLKHIFASAKLPWVLKRHAINFLFCIMEGVEFLENNDEPLDCSVYMPRLYTALQAIQLVMVYAADPLLRKKAFDTLKMVLSDLPSSLRFDVLMALIRNSELSSMIAILLDCVKEEMRKEYLQKVSRQNGASKADNNIAQHLSPFLTAKVLDFVEFVLKPPMGGPPSLPEFTDAVMAALNLYRFVLITESSGNTNYTEVMSKNKLQKVYREWLEPLRAFVSGMAAEIQKDDNQLEFDACAFNPVEFVLYRCIELVEENLKRHT